MASNDFWELVEKEKKKKKSSKNGTTATVPNNKTTASKRGGSDNTGDFWSKVDKYKQDKTTATIPERKNLVDAREDIAPVKKQEDDGKLLEFFQKSSLFEDGYDRGDVAKTILATGADIDIGIFKGVARVGENIGKLAGYGIAGVSDLMGKDKYADEVRERAKTNYVDLLTGKLDSHLDKYSVLGRTSDAVMEGLGQIGVTVATSGLGAAAGMSSAGVTALNSSLMFAQGMGGGMNEAYLEGATDGEALAYGALAGTADALSEMLFAGLGKGAKATGAGFGLSGLDDMLAKKASNLFKSQIAKNLVQYGIKASAEGFEEVLAGVAQGIAKRITYLRDEAERGETNLWQILKDENLLEQFVVGSVISGFAQSGDLINSIQTNTDFVSGMTKNEQAVVDHEYKKRLEKETQNGKKISGREKSKIYDRVVSEMEKGYLSTDTIEEVLGGETYKEYKGVVDNENNLKKEVDELIKESDKYEDIPTNQLTGRQQMRRDYLRDLIPELQNQIRNNENSTTKKDLKSKLENEVMNMVRGDRLSESYAEKERVYQKLDIDPETFSKAKHAEAAKQTVASAVELGANNTNRVRDLVEHAAQISGKTGKAFFFKDNDTIKNSFIERQTKAIENLEQIEHRDAKQNKLLDAMKQKLEDVKSGKIIVNGENSADGIVLNIDSKNPLMVTVGHEVTHDTENVKHYDKMKKALFAYAKTKGIDVETRIAMAKAEYEGIADADAEHEVVADLAGEMLFTDDAFVEHLARTDTNVFQSLWNDIKNLVKMATPGSKEARELERVQYKFEKAYKQAAKSKAKTTGVKHSLSSDQQKHFDYNEKRTEVGSSLKTLKGSAIKRSTKFGVGKEIGGEIYAHKNYAQEIVPAEVLSKAESLLAENYPDFQYNALKYNPKTGVVAFQEAPDFDTAREPVVGDYVSVNTNTGAVKTGHSNYIWHHNTVTPYKKIGMTAALVTRNDDAQYSLGYSKIVNTLTGEEIDTNTYQVLDRLDNGDVVTPDELANLKEVQEGKRRMNGLVQDFIDKNPEFGIIPFKDVGTYLLDSEERVQLRNKIIAERLQEGSFSGIDKDGNEEYNGSVKKDRRLDIVMGLPASGKSTSIVNPLSQFYESVVIDSDMIKTRLPEFDGGWGASLVHEESSIINMELLGKTLLEGSNIVLPIVGAKVKSVEKYIDLAKSEGYDVHVHLNELPNGKAVGRMLKRYFSQGRFIDPSFALDYGNKPTAVYEQIRQRGDIGGYSRWDNDVSRGQRPRQTDISENDRVYGEYSSSWRASRSTDSGSPSGRVESETSNQLNTETSSEDGVFFNAQNKKYSLSDTNGRQLSEGQNEFFKNSKVRDEDGNLKVMHHGSPESFTVFDKKKAKASGYYGKGFYFTDSDSHAKQYGNTYDVYLNITNPLQDGTTDITREQLRKFVEAIAEDEDYGIDNYGYGATVDSVTDSVYGKSDFAMLMDINASCVGNMVEAIQLFNEVNGTDYNGIIAPTETVAFYPNQIKKVDNLNPTSDPDIRYSLTDTKASDAQPVGTGLTGRDILTKQSPVQTSANYDVMGATPETNIESRIRPNVVEEEAPVAPMPVETAPVAENAITEDIAPMPAIDTRREVYTDADAPADLLADIESRVRSKHSDIYGYKFWIGSGKVGSFRHYKVTAPDGTVFDGVSKNPEATVAETIAKEYGNATPITAPVAEDDIAPVAALVEREEYEAIRPQKPARQVDEDIAPVRGEKMVRLDSNNGRPGEKRRKWIGTSTESEVVDGQIVPDDLDQELIHYQPISNKKTLGNANSMLDSMGYESSVSYMNQRFASSKVSLDDIALGERLIQEAVKRGDTETAKDLIMDISILGTELGQKVQALSIIKRLTPEGQLKMLMRTVERGKAKNDKAFEGVEVTNEMAKEILDTRNADGTYDQDKLNTAVENVKQKLAKEMKSTILERINEWRYLSMLGNPKTHIRNLVSNVAMYGTRQLKNAIARTGETLAGKKIERTKTWQRASKEVRDFAKQVASQEYGTEKTSKYSEAGDLKSRRQVLKIKALDVASKANSAALSAEDTWFSKPAYRQALQEYLTANGIRTEEDIQKNGKLIAQAKQYAKLQAQEATFQQDSYIANKISEIERKNAVTNVLIGSVMPFKKTPINIAKAGLSYSPLGFARNVYDAVKVSKGEMNASTAIDHFAQTLTGTSLAVLGYVLASRGILNGAGKDDKEGKYDYQLGKQAYSFNFDGDSFSLSWLSPVAMPLFVGANAYEILVEDKDWDYNVVGEALAQTLDPMNEMSFLSSLTDVLSSYDSGMAAFGGMLESAVQSYITSFVPTLFSQIAQVKDDKKRSTKIDANSGQDFLDETWNQIKYKIPGLRQTLEPSTDIWGNEIPLSENAVTKALKTFILPYSRKDNIATKVDEEIKNIYRLTGENGVIPNVPYNYINYKNEKYEMTAKEHTEYKKVYGQTAYQLMEDLIYNDTYQRASAKEKAKMMDEVFNYARDKANQGFLAGRGVDYFNTTKDNVPTYKDNAILGAIENDMTIDEYKMYRDNPEMYAIADAIGGFKVYENYKKATNGMKLAEKADYIGKMKGLSTEQKNLLVNSETDREEPIDLTGYENYDSFEEFEFAKNYPKKYSVAKVVADNFSTYVGIEDEITRIKTDNPSSSGVKDKDLVKEYIFSLDLDEGQKALLYRSMYSSKSDKSKYNRQIVEYLDNRDDISWEEMKEILIGLDFTITDGNRIKW